MAFCIQGVILGCRLRSDGPPGHMIPVPEAPRLQRDPDVSSRPRGLPGLCLQSGLPNNSRIRTSRIPEPVLPCQGVPRVFKKASPNGKLTVYLGKRDFVDHIDVVDPVDGVVLVDPEYLKERKGNGLGLPFRKDLFVANAQAFPPAPEDRKPLTRLQERLIKKLGEHAYPFTFEIPPNLPCSVTLQPGPEDTGKACGVDYEVKAFCAENLEEKIHKRNSVRLVIRKVQYAPERPGPQPMAETTRQFLMSDKPLHLEASLDKEIYYHGEPISVNVHVTNNTNKTVKKIKISVRQYADICLFNTAQYKCPVAVEDADDVVAPSSTFCKVYTLTPFLANNREKRGLALDGKLKHEDTNLASSTLLRDGANKEILGIIVSYKVKVKLVVSRGGLLGDLASSDVAVELPFTLMHPKPKEEPPHRDGECRRGSLSLVALSWEGFGKSRSCRAVQLGVLNLPFRDCPRKIPGSSGISLGKSSIPGHT
ncbi:PREDICTED: beta-arrestin-1 [Tinamus guttatus]|uniref:beta-arrestin-1 n=1 Tax=Tinamus guttatus TaxID=94827 RepID=UPI00052EB9A9|nr:PREDICTED: beta-arrestin-1 [Tinamus guttatus]